MWDSQGFPIESPIVVLVVHRSLCVIDLTIFGFLQTNIRLGFLLGPRLSPPRMPLCFLAQESIVLVDLLINTNTQHSVSAL